QRGRGVGKDELPRQVGIAPRFVQPHQRGEGRVVNAVRYGASVASLVEEPRTGAEQRVVVRYENRLTAADRTRRLAVPEAVDRGQRIDVAQQRGSPDV